MRASEKIKSALRMTDSEMIEWTALFQQEASLIGPEENKQRRLEEIRQDVDRYFLAEMDRRFRDEAPLSDPELFELIDAYLIEIGIIGIPARRTRTSREPERTA